MKQRILSGVLVLSCALTGHAASLTGKCARMVSLSPSITDTLAMLELLPNVVGVTRYCTTPEKMPIPHVGGMIDTNYEAVISLNPSLILIQGDSHSAQTKLFENFAKPIQSLSYGTIDESINSIATIGRVCGLETESAKIREEIRTTLETLARQAPKIVPKVLILYGFKYDLKSGTPPMSAAGLSYHQELLERLGGINAYQGHSNAPQLSQEAILTLDPDIIILLSGDGLVPDFAARYQLKVRPYQPNWPLLTGARALSNHRVYLIDGFASMIPSPRGIEALAKAFAEVLR